MKKLIAKRIFNCRFQFSTNRHKIHIDTLFDSTYKHTCIIGGSLSSAILSSALFRIGKLGNHEIKLFQKNTFYNYIDLFPLFLFDFKIEEDIHLPTLKIFNEFIDIEFENVESFSPEKNIFSTFEKNYKYTNLVLATDPLPDFTKIKGLENYLDPDEISFQGKVGSLHDFSAVSELKNIFKYFDGGKVIFYQDSSANFPYNILNTALLFQNNLEKNKNLLKRTEILYVTDDKFLMKNQVFSEYLEKLLKEKNISLLKETKLKEVNSEENKVFLLSKKTKKTQDFTLLVLEPEYNLSSYTDLLQNSPFFTKEKFNFLGNTLKNKDFENVYCLTTQPSLYQNFICSQESQFQMSFVIANNILAEKLNKVTKNSKNYIDFNGTFSFPIFTNKNKCVVLEKNNKDFKIHEQTFKNWAKHGYAYPYLFKRFLPKGRWFGPSLKFSRPKLE